MRRVRNRLILKTLSRCPLRRRVRKLLNLGKLAAIVIEVSYAERIGVKLLLTADYGGEAQLIPLEKVSQKLCQVKEKLRLLVDLTRLTRLQLYITAICNSPAGP